MVEWWKIFGFFGSVLRRAKPVLIALATAFLGAATAYGTPDTALPAVALTPGSDGPPLQAYIRFEPSSALPSDLSDLHARAENMQAVTTPTINFGPPGDPLLVLLKVTNTGPENGFWILTTRRGSLRSFELLEYDQTGRRQIIDGADLKQVGDVLDAFQAFSVELVLSPGEERVFAFTFDPENSTYFPLKIQSYSSFFKDRRYNISMTAFVVAGIIVIVLLNGIIFTVTGNKSFLWLGLAEAAFVINTLHAEGYTTVFYLYRYPELSFIVGDAFKCAFAGAMAQFARSVLKTKQAFPNLNLLLLGIIVLSLSVILTQPLLLFAGADLRTLVHLAGWVASATSALVLPVVGYQGVRQHGIVYAPLLIGWSGLAAYIVYMAIVITGLAPDWPFAWHWVGPIGLMEAILAMVSLGLQLRKLQLDRLAGEAALSESLKEQLRVTEESHRLLLEREAAKATLADQANLMQSSGHDSRQVLLALNAAADALESSSDGTQDGVVSLLRGSAHHLTNIVETTVAPSISGTASIDQLAISEATMGQIIGPLDAIYAPLFARKNICLDVTGNNEDRLVTDQPLLARVLSNLLNNALKFTDSGSVALNWARTAEAMTITVADTGCGMEPSMVDRLNRGADGRTLGSGDRSGMGLGFQSSRLIMERLAGGSICVHSAPEEGTTITLTLPFGQPASEDMEGQLAVMDLDMLGRADLEAQAQEARRDGQKTVVMTSDQSGETRNWVTARADIVVYKPLDAHQAAPFLDQTEK